jgi:hypothetical protein
MESSASAGRVASAVLDPRRWRALALPCGASFMVLLDGTITIAALPSIRSQRTSCQSLTGGGCRCRRRRGDQVRNETSEQRTDSYHPRRLRRDS